MANILEMRRRGFTGVIIGITGDADNAALEEFVTAGANACLVSSYPYSNMHLPRSLVYHWYAQFFTSWITFSTFFTHITGQTHLSWRSYGRFDQKRAPFYHHHPSRRHHYRTLGINHHPYRTPCYVALVPLSYEDYQYSSFQYSILR